MCATHTENGGGGRGLHHGGMDIGFISLNPLVLLSWVICRAGVPNPCAVAHYQAWKSKRQASAYAHLHLCEWQASTHTWSILCEQRPFVPGTVRLHALACRSCRAIPSPHQHHPAGLQSWERLGNFVVGDKKILSFKLISCSLYIVFWFSDISVDSIMERIISRLQNNFIPIKLKIKQYSINFFILQV